MFAASIALRGEENKELGPVRITPALSTSAARSWDPTTRNQRELNVMEGGRNGVSERLSAGAKTQCIGCQNAGSQTLEVEPLS